MYVCKKILNSVKKEGGKEVIRTPDINYRKEAFVSGCEKGEKAA